MPIHLLLLILFLPWSLARAEMDAPQPAPAATLVSAINAVRLVEDRPLLQLEPKLVAAAKAHAADMAARGYFDHRNPDGEGLAVRLARAGYRFALALQNIAAGQRDPHGVIADWLESNGHRENLLDPNVRDIGAAHLYYDGDPAVARHRHYWVVVLGLADRRKLREHADARR